MHNKLDNVLKQQFADALKVLRDNKADVIGISDKFYKSNRKEYNKFINKMGTEDDFINFVNFKLNLTIQAD